MSSPMLMCVFRIVTPQQWGSFSAHNATDSEVEIQASVRLREVMNQTIRQTTADLEAQWTATHYAFRKRKHELDQTKNELEWQQKNVRYKNVCTTTGLHEYKVMD